MKYIIRIILLIQIGTIIFQIRTDRKQNNTLSLHQNNFIGVDHFGGWAIPILEAAKPDTIPTWKDYSIKHIVPKDNKK
jgi:hypothetical protein